MDDLFTKKVRAAAVAGWWTLLIVACFGLVQWLLYLFIMSRRPDCLLALMGGAVTWSTLITMWLWTLAAFKIGVWFVALVVIWLTLWARQLSRHKE
ncbi:MAG: hypothetical protein ABR911_12415 [Syntrophales bacterium]|jgi:hypothetical protein